jgi:hypothetical protein
LLRPSHKVIAAFGKKLGLSSGEDFHCLPGGQKRDSANRRLAEQELFGSAIVFRTIQRSESHLSLSILNWFRKSEPQVTGSRDSSTTIANSLVG